MTSGHDDPLEEPARPEGPRDLANWAMPVGRLHVTQVPEGVANINVDGRRVVGAIQGFGQLWRKTYRIRLHGAAVTPAEVIAVWKERFSSFWPMEAASTPRSRAWGQAWWPCWTRCCPVISACRAA